MKSLFKQIEDNFAKDMAKVMSEELEKALQGVAENATDEDIDKLNKILSDDKAVVDPIYLQSIKTKVEKILNKIIEKYELGDYLSDNYRCRICPSKMVDSKYYKLYEDSKDIDGKTLRYGHEYVPENFEDWKATYLTDYMNAEVIYDEMCRSKRIQKSDLIILNSLAKRYGVVPK